MIIIHIILVDPFQVKENRIFFSGFDPSSLIKCILDVPIPTVDHVYLCILRKAHSAGIGLHSILEVLRSLYYSK